MLHRFQILRPSFEDHFPSTRVGHGQAHGPIPADGSPRRRKIARCGQSTCELNRAKGGEKHADHGANVSDWREERGIGKAKKVREKKDQHPTLGAIVPITTNPPPDGKCSSCGHVPTGEQKDPGLQLGVCSRCWRRGYSMHKSLKEGQ